MLKTTSLVTAVPLTTDLYSRRTRSRARTSGPSRCCWWPRPGTWSITSVLMVGQFYLERHFARGQSRQLTGAPAAGPGSRRRPTGPSGGRMPVTRPPMVDARSRAQELRLAAGAQGIDLDGPARPGAVPGRAVRLGQVDVPALHQPPREGERRRLYVDGVLVGYEERGGKLHELHPRVAARQRRDIGMVFQHFNLFPHMTALENVIEAPMQVKKLKKAAAVAIARAAARPGRPGRQGRRLPGAALGRPAAAGRDRPGARDGAEADALRRADLGARPGTGRRGARRHARARRRPA